MNGWLALTAAVGSMAYKASADDALRVALTGLDEPVYQRAPRASVSLIVPAYNEHKYIGNLLQSARNQTESFGEIIIADCSDPGEGTAPIAQAWGVRTIHVPKGNIAGSRNAGARSAHGDVLVFADADMILSQQFLEKALDILESGKVLAHPKMALYDSMGWHMIMHLPQMLRWDYDPTGCIAIRAGDFWNVGGYNEMCNPIIDAQCHEDTDFGRRVLELYGPAALKIIPTYIGTSARRYKKFGLNGWGDNFSTSVRSYQEIGAA